MRNILVPTDFSEYADNALDYAISLSKKMLANVHVIHLIEQPAYDNFDAFADGYGGSGMDDVFMLKLIEKSKRDLAALKEKYEGEIETSLKLTNSIQKTVNRVFKRHKC